MDPDSPFTSLRGDSPNDGIRSTKFQTNSNAVRLPPSFSTHHARRGSAATAIAYQPKSLKYLLTVIPPHTLPHDPPHPRTSPAASGYGPPAHFRRGTLVPLYSTLASQLGAIAREYGLPSTGGLVLYLSTASDPTSLNAASMPGTAGMAGEGGPRIGEEVWSILWGRLFEAEEEERRLALEFEQEEDYPIIPAVPSSYRNGNGARSNMLDEVTPPSPSTPQHPSYHTERGSSLASETEAEQDQLAYSDVGGDPEGSNSSQATGGSRFSKFGAARGFSTSQGSATTSQRSGVLPSPSFPSPSPNLNSGPQSYAASPHVPLRNMNDGASHRSPSARYGARSYTPSRSLYNPPLSSSTTSSRPLGGVGWGSSVIVGRVEFDIDQRGGRGKWFESYVAAAQSPIRPSNLNRSLTPFVRTKPYAEDEPSLPPPQELFLPAFVGQRVRSQSQSQNQIQSQGLGMEGEGERLAVEVPQMRVRSVSGRSRQITSGASGYSVEPQFDGTILERPDSSRNDSVHDGSHDSLGYSQLTDEDNHSSSPTIQNLDDIFPSDEATWRAINQQPSVFDDDSMLESDSMLAAAGLGIHGAADPTRTFPGAFAERHHETPDEAGLPPPQDDVADVVQLLSAKKSDSLDLASPIQLSATFEQHATFASAPHNVAAVADSDGNELAMARRRSTEDEVYHSPLRLGSLDWNRNAPAPIDIARKSPAVIAVDPIKEAPVDTAADVSVAETNRGLMEELDELEAKLSELSPPGGRRITGRLREIETARARPKPTQNLTITRVPLPQDFLVHRPIPITPSEYEYPREAPAAPTPVLVSKSTSSLLDATVFPLPPSPVTRSGSFLTGSKSSPQISPVIPESDEAESLSPNSLTPASPALPTKSITFQPGPLRETTQPSRLLRAAGKSLKLAKGSISSESEGEGSMSGREKSPLGSFFEKKPFSFFASKQKKDSQSSTDSSTSPTSYRSPSFGDGYAQALRSPPAFDPVSFSNQRKVDIPYFPSAHSLNSSSSSLPLPMTVRPFTSESFRTDSADSIGRASFTTAREDLNASTSSTIKPAPSDFDENDDREIIEHMGQEENRAPTPLYNTVASPTGSNRTLPRGFEPSTPLASLPQHQNHAPSNSSLSSSSSYGQFNNDYGIDSPIVTENTPKTFSSSSASKVHYDYQPSRSNSKFRLSEDQDLSDLLKQMEEIYDTESEADELEHSHGTQELDRGRETSVSDSDQSDLSENFTGRIEAGGEMMSKFKFGGGSDVVSYDGIEKGERQYPRGYGEAKELI